MAVQCPRRSAGGPARNASCGMMGPMVDASRYFMAVEWSDEDAACIATVPELPGCRTYGQTRAEAVRQGEDAIASWLDAAAWDVPIPAPRFFEAPCTDVQAMQSAGR